METFNYLPSFLQELRQEGIPVGIRELDWLRRIFALQPELDRQGLHQVLLCTLIKTPQHRQRFDDLFDVWCPLECPDKSGEAESTEAEAVEEAGHGAVEQDTTTPSTHTTAPSTAAVGQRDEPERSHARPSPQPAGRRLWLWGVLSAAGVLGVGFGFFKPLALQAFRFADGLFIGLGAAIWAATAWIWRHYHAQHLPPPPSTTTLQDGPAWQPLPPLPDGGAQLLAPEDIRKMVWSVGRFVSEDVTRQLDTRRTVNATAQAGGQAVLHYQHAIHPREVWLWVDQTTHDLAMQRLVWEMYYTLERAGLPCRQAAFRDVPEPVTWEQGESFTPLSMEGHRQGAIVLVLSNGEGLNLVQSLTPERPALAVLLHALAEWPALAFVDVSHGQYGLAELLQPYAVRCLVPEEIPAFLGAETRQTGQRLRIPLAGDVKAWAAGIALCPDPVDVKQALALHRAMGLQVAPWALTVLLEQGNGVGHSLEWTPQERAAWLNWLGQVEGLDGGVPADSKLGRALQFWWQCYERQASQATGSPAVYRLAIERALLQLWRKPERAAEQLYTIYTSTNNAAASIFQEEIAQRLGRYVARSASVPEPALDASEILLPWHWEALAAETRALLYRMGFASRWLSAAPLHVPGTLALTLGVFWGVAVALLVQGGVIGWCVLAGLSVTTGIRARQITQQRVKEEVAEPLEMVAITGRPFLMGSAQDDAQAYSDEHPQHQVTVSDFLMARCPVTRKQYQEVTGQCPEEWKGIYRIVEWPQQFWRIVSRQGSLRALWEEFHPRLPANYVSWFDAVQFCNALSEQQGLQPCYRIAGEQVTWDEEADGYRLPTETEWEYAARAGTTTHWFCGDEPTDLGEYAWYRENAGDRIHPVGQKAPNPWGLSDMAGNVYEWCWDWYAAYEGEAVKDPIGANSGGSRVLRGGASWNEVRNLRSANRNRNEPTNRNDDIGVRVVRRPGRQHAVCQHRAGSARVLSTRYPDSRLFQ